MDCGRSHYCSFKRVWFCHDERASF